MAVPEGVRAAHEELSPVAGRFMDYLLAHPEICHSRGLKDHPLAPQWLRYPYALQSWPTFIGNEKLQEITRATVGVSQLVRSIPERVFDKDARRITTFYGLDSESLTAYLFESPSGLEGALTRCDLVGGEEGLKCVEVNGSANLGGWQLRHFELACLQNPPIAPFLATEEELRPVHRDPWHAALSHIVDETCRAGIAGQGELNLALMIADSSMPEEEQRQMKDLFVKVLAEASAALQGEVFLCTAYNQLIAHGTRLSWRGRRVHAVLEYGVPGETPRHVYRCFKAESIGLYNGPLAALLSDKRNLALLSELEDSDRFNAAERALVRDHVPWSRSLVDGRTTFHGEPVSLLAFAIANRESMVLKPADGSMGKDVHIGAATPPEEWSARVQVAAGSRSHLLQEYVRSRPYLFQNGPAGFTEHDLVWGTFCFGSTYGGGFLRMLPCLRGPSVINSARGATEGLMFEV
jgi:hypothetical protein